MRIADAPGPQPKPAPPATPAAKPATTPATTPVRATPNAALRAERYLDRFDPPGPRAPVVYGPPAPPPKPPVSPEVKKAEDDITQYPPELRAQQLASHLEAHQGNRPEDVAFRSQLLQDLGPAQVADMLSRQGKVDGIYDDGRGIRTILAASATAYTPAEQGQLVKGAGAENLSKALAAGVNRVGDPTVDPTTAQAERATLEAASRVLGNVSALPPGSAGRDEVKATLDALVKGNDLLQQTPGVEAAAWVVARSGSDALKVDFAQPYLDAFQKDPASLSSAEARAVAMTLGSTSSSNVGMAPLTALDHDQRKAFLATMTQAEYLESPESFTPANFRRDVVEGVGGFLTQVATINPSNFKDPAAAEDLRVQTFRAATEAVDNDLFEGSQRYKDGLANIFVTDTANLIHELANTTGPNADTEGKDLAKFFDQVAFQSEGNSRGWVTSALQQYLGVGSRQGVADVLAANKGDPAFMASKGNVMARDLGFALGALHQGAQSALQAIDGDAKKQAAVVGILGGIAEAAIGASPVSGAYEAIKKGTGGAADVKKVFDWLTETYVNGPAGEKKAGVSGLADAIISGALAPFFGDASLTGARPSELVDLYALINAGAALADGTVSPSIKISG